MNEEMLPDENPIVPEPLAEPMPGTPEAEAADEMVAEGGPAAARAVQQELVYRPHLFGLRAESSRLP